jgi:motility quorum-sensing regulator/GCU-specific mRNA interferase toxin
LVEKRTPHYDLVRIQAEVAWLGTASFTRTALDGGRMMGLTTAEMLGVIASLSRRNFYKAMTAYADHRVWQDVYHAGTPVRKVAFFELSRNLGRTASHFGGLRSVSRSRCAARPR